MAIEREFSKFATDGRIKEERFTLEFLCPLMRRLGFLVVVPYHGQREFGKDLILGEVDRFSNFIFHGLQAKFEDSISQADSHKLVDDCREAFGHPFTHPVTGQESHISTFIVANAGTLADNARTIFLNDATNREHGGHVKLLDGKALLQLDRFATMARVEQIGETLAGLKYEIGHNLGYFQNLRGALSAWRENHQCALPSNRPRLTGAQQYLARPILPAIIDFDNMSQFCHCLEAVHDGLDAMFHVNLASCEEMAQSMLDTLIPDGLQRSAILIACINSAMSQLGPLAAA